MIFQKTPKDDSLITEILETKQSISEYGLHLINSEARGVREAIGESVVGWREVIDGGHEEDGRFSVLGTRSRQPNSYTSDRRLGLGFVEYT